jgi:hypothetical protein
MDPWFVATPGEAAIAATLRMWPAMDGLRVRALPVSAFGLEKGAGELWVASPIDLSCERVASSVEELQRLIF